MPNDVYVKLQTVVENIVSLTTYESAEEIEKAVKSARYKEDQWIGGIFDALMLLREIPAADVELVRHGRWIKQELAPSKKLFCSECSLVKPKWGNNYCPGCGAKMDAEPPKGEANDV